jgi:renalase
MTIAIIGAGLAGLTCAHALRQHGKDVAVFDKGRGPGGRMSTRRAQTPLGELRFDHGAQYISAEREDFAAQLRAWAQEGVLAPWEGRFIEIGPGGATRPLAEKTRWVGVPSMNALIKHLAAPFAVDWSARVIAVEGCPGAWRLEFEGDPPQKGEFEAVLLAIPAEQAGPLLAPVASDMAARAKAVVSAPSWTGMLAFATTRDAGFDGARLTGDGPIGWMARGPSKPGRGPAETWVVQATPAWSRAHLEDDADAVATALARAFQSIVPGQAPVHVAAHRWRYAQAEVPVGAPCQFDPALGLGTCGDWHLGGQCEQAWRSGNALAQTLFDAGK